MTIDYVVSILKLILIDLVLSGDNAVVIGLAAHLLPPRQRRQAMIWGCAMAIVMRIALTLVVAELLLVPGIRLVGALLLGWIACKLIQEEAESEDATKPPPTTLFKAITRIATADFIMSLDNILAIAGASESDPVRVIVGLMMSITMLLLLSAVITEFMSRYHWIAYVGAGVLAWTAADMMVQDLHLMSERMGGGTHFPAWAAWTIRVFATVLCLTTNWWWPARTPQGEPEPSDSAHLSSTMDPPLDLPREMPA